MTRPSSTSPDHVELLPSGLRARTGRGDQPRRRAVHGRRPEPRLPGARRGDELLDFAGRWGRERVPQRSPFRVGIHLRENRHGRTGRRQRLRAARRHAGLRLRRRAGLRRAHGVERQPRPLRRARRSTATVLLGGGELLLAGEVRLATGERYTSPWLYGAFGVGLDAVARRFHAHLRSRPRPVSADRPVTLNVWEAVYFDHDLERLIDLAERAAEVGVERYVLDDGWFGARRHDTRGARRLGRVAGRLARRAAPARRPRARARACSSGCGSSRRWSTPTPTSPARTRSGSWPPGAEWPVESRFQQVLNLGHPRGLRARQGRRCWRCSTSTASATSSGTTTATWSRPATQTRRRPRPACTPRPLAFYRLLDELRAAHPGLEIESCSSGGARVDLGVLERTDRVWVSDCIDPLERQHIMRWTTQLVAPEYLGSHIASGRSHTTGRVHSLSSAAAPPCSATSASSGTSRRRPTTELAELGSG